MSDASPEFPVRHPSTLFVSVLGAFEHVLLQKFLLTQSTLLRTGNGGLHEELALGFKGDRFDGWYGIIANRTQPYRADQGNNGLSRTSSDVSDASKEVLEARKPKEVQDCAKGFNPVSPPGPWWKAPPVVNDIDIVDLAVTRSNRPCLNLLDVVLVLNSISEHAPHYVVTRENCWWYARCAAIILEMLALESLPDIDDFVTNFSRRAPLPQLPLGYDALKIINNERVCRDIRTILEIFNQKVCDPYYTMIQI